MNTKDFLFSASSVKEYLQCGLKFKFGRIDKLPKGDIASHHRWFGSLVHSLIYLSFSTGGKLRDHIDESYVQDAFETLWSGKESTESYLETIRKSLGEKPTGKFLPLKTASATAQMDIEMEWKNEAWRMVRNGIQVVRGIHEVLNVEKKLLWSLASRKFVGYIDILGRDNSGQYEFYDLKTTWDAPSKKQLSEDLQFFSYSHALRQNHKLDYYPAGYYVHLRTGAKLKYEPTPQLTASSEVKVANAIKNLEADIFFDSYGSPLCAYCDYRHLCYSPDKVWKISSSYDG